MSSDDSIFSRIENEMRQHKTFDQWLECQRNGRSEFAFGQYLSMLMNVAKDKKLGLYQLFSQAHTFKKK